RTVADVLVIDGKGGAARRPGGLATYLESRRTNRAKGKTEAKAPSGSKAAPAAAAPAQRSTSPSTLRRELNAAERSLAKATT
ncbi:MAG TPA: hypothetical protein DCS55_19190, partial [Acidimicrobiaceae bacterium]|nr:hypothetical protein [Acidimicrobiaceae bacterium]